ncbi:SRPBCC family protein [Novosphingobium sp.]|uniref:SRPBCC family protein n=1 Tax=Novosphingobium sp. TaxID=1874826 RepID=UPI003BADB8A6
MPKASPQPPRDSFTHDDISLLARVQQGMASSGFQSVWLSDEEARVQHFHNALDAALAGD